MTIGRDFTNSLAVARTVASLSINIHQHAIVLTRVITCMLRIFLDVAPSFRACHLFQLRPCFALQILFIIISDAP